MLRTIWSYVKSFIAAQFVVYFIALILTVGVGLRGEEMTSEYLHLVYAVPLGFVIAFDILVFIPGVIGDIRNAKKRKEYEAAEAEAEKRREAYRNSPEYRQQQEARLRAMLRRASRQVDH